jgi:hypothetical protein
LFQGSSQTVLLAPGILVIYWGLAALDADKSYQYLRLTTNTTGIHGEEAEVEDKPSKYHETYKSQILS